MPFRDLVKKAKNIFGVNNRNTGGMAGFNSSNNSMEQMVRLLTGDNGKAKSYTPEEIMREYKSWIFACSNINAAAVASTPLRLYATTQNGQSNKYLHPHRVLDNKEISDLSKRADFKALSKITPSVEVVEIVDHPLLTLLRKFNDNRNYFESIENTSIGLDLIGNSYWYLDFKGMQQPQELFVLMPQYMTIVPGERVFLKGYIYGRNASSGVKFRNSEIIHFRTPNPNSLYYGIGCAQAAAMGIERNELLDISENSTLKNKARPDFIVQYKGGKLDPSTKRDIEKMWNNAMQGSRKSGKIKVMDEDFDLKTLGFKPEEMGYPAGRIWTLKEIAGVFGVPYSMLDSSDTKKATSESAKLWHTQNAVVPRLKRIEEKLNEKLVSLYDDRLFLMFDNPVPEDVAQQTASNSTYIANGVMSINEVRRSLGLVPFEDEKFEQPFATGNSGNSSAPVEIIDDEVDEVVEEDNNMEDTNEE